MAKAARANRSRGSIPSIAAQENSLNKRDAIEILDRVFHEKARLGILTSLIGEGDGLNFNELKELCDLTDGNLNRHLKVLIDAGVLHVKKTGQGRSTNSVYRLTANGRRAFDQYLSALEVVLLAARKHVDQSNTDRNPQHNPENLSYEN